MLGKNNFKSAFRALKRQKVYSSLGILGFAIGLSVFINILLFVDHEYNVDKGYEDYERIFRIVEAGQEGQNADIDYALSEILSTQYPEIEIACPVRQKEKWPFVFRTNETFIKTSSFISTTNDFFKLFSVDVLTSLGENPLSDKNAVVLTQSSANRLFPGKDALGQSVAFLGDEELIVSAIIKDLPEESSFKADLILNSENPQYRFGRTVLNGKVINPINHFILLKKGNNPEKLERSLNKTLSSYNSNVNQVQLQPVKSIYFSKGISGDYNKKGNSTLIYLLEAIALIILVLASINYIHFILATQLSTKKSASIKRIHGAGFKTLLAYYFTEALISLGISLLLAIGFVAVGLPFVNEILGTSLNPQRLFSPLVLSIWAGTVLFIVFTVALLSGWAASKDSITTLLKLKTISLKNPSSTFLSVFQMTASVTLLVCAIGVTRQLRMIQQSSLGFDADHILRLDMPTAFNEFNTLKEKVMELSFVEKCAWSCGGPGYINLEGTIEIGGKPVSVHGISGDNDLLATMGIKFLEGRNFLPSDKEKSCLVNQATLKALGCQNFDELISTKNKIFGKNIIGVVNDFNIASLHSKIEPSYIAFSDEDRSCLNIKLYPGNILEQAKQLKNIWEEVIPGQPYDPIFYDEYFDSLYDMEERQGKAIAFFSCIAIFITCLGLLGQIIQRSTLRTKEIGIRKVNGARVSEILIMLNKDFIKWVAIAFVIATPTAWYIMNKWLENFAYKTELSWWIFALSGILALGIALLTVSWQSWKAATRNPVEALRYE